MQTATPDSPPAASAEAPPLRVVVVDPAAMTREAIQVALDAAVGFRVVGTAATGIEAATLAIEEHPDVLVVDLAWPRTQGLDALEQLTGRRPEVPIVVLTETLTGKDSVIALMLGARGVVLLGAVPSVLHECLRAVAKGAYWVGKAHFPDAVAALRGLRHDAPVTLPHRLKPDLTSAADFASAPMSQSAATE